MQSRLPNLFSTTLVILALSNIAVVVTQFDHSLSAAIQNSDNVLLRSVSWLLPDLLFLLFPACLLREARSSLRTFTVVLFTFMLFISGTSRILDWQPNSDYFAWSRSIHLTALYKGLLLGIGWSVIFREVWITLPLLCAATFYVKSVGVDLIHLSAASLSNVYLLLSPAITLLPAVVWLEYRARHEPPHPPLPDTATP